MAKAIWGINPILEYLRHAPEKIEEIVISKKELRGKVHQIVEKAKKLGLPVRIKKDFAPPGIPPEANTQGVVAYLKEFDYAELEELFRRAKEKGEKPLFLALDEITDPQNLGSLIRSAVAAGAHGIIIPKHRAAGITGTVVKVSAGAVSHIPIHQTKNLGRLLEDLKERDLWIAGLDARAGSTIYQLDLDLPLTWVVGSEGKGLRPSIREKCDFLAAIPMRGPLDSLNAAIAGAIALFETIRQRYYR